MFRVLQSLDLNLASPNMATAAGQTDIAIDVCKVTSGLGELALLWRHSCCDLVGCESLLSCNLFGTLLNILTFLLRPLAFTPAPTLPCCSCAHPSRAYEFLISNCKRYAPDAPYVPVRTFVDLELRMSPHV